MSIVAVKKWIEQSFVEKFPDLDLVDYALDLEAEDAVVSIHIPEVEANTSLYAGQCLDRALVDIIVARNCMANITDLFNDLIRDDARRVNSEELSIIATNIYLWAAENNFFAETAPEGYEWPKMLQSTVLAVSRITPEFTLPKEAHVIQTSVPCNLYPSELPLSLLRRFGAEQWAVASPLDPIEFEIGIN